MPGDRESDTDAWREANRISLKVGRRRMKRAILLARKGKVDPDDEYSYLYVLWARTVLSAGRRFEWLDNSALKRVGAFLLGMVSLGVLDYFDAWLGEKSWIRDAKTIMNLYEERGTTD